MSFNGGPTFNSPNMMKLYFPHVRHEEKCSCEFFQVSPQSSQNMQVM